jgi:SIR2-like domain
MKATRTKKPKPSAKRPKPKARSADMACMAFMELVKRYSFEGKPISRLTNMTFWAGAGFSKAWEPSAPVGEQLFTLPENLLGDLGDILSRIVGLEPGDDMSPDQLRQIVYRLDMYDRYPDLRSRYVDDQSIRVLRGALRSAVWKSFNRISILNYIDVASGKFLVAAPTKAQRDMVSFFDYLQKRVTGSGAVVEGLRPHFVTTNYDFVIETILDNTLGPDDSLFNYTYRGITPRKIVPFSDPVTIHEHWLVNHLLKLNGGFEILPDQGGYSLCYTRRSNTEVAENPPVLIMPSREQDYSDPYFKAMFPKTVRLMRESAVLVLVGYSLPEDDALIRFILRQFAEEQEDGLGKFIFYIDLMPNAKKRARLVEVFPWIEEIDSFPRILLYEGGFADFARECLSLVAP